MKDSAPDPNDTLREKGEHHVRWRFDHARNFDGLHSDPGDPISLKDFHAYMPNHKYIFVPTREMWPAESVNARVPAIRMKDGKTISASTWLDQKQPVEQMTWAPGQPVLIRDR